MKILQTTPDGLQRRTVIPKHFDQLPEGYLSLGQEWGYYDELEKLGVKEEVLEALRDITLHPGLEAVGREDLDRTLLRFPEARSIYAGERVQPFLAMSVYLKGFEGPHELDMAFGGPLGRLGVIVGRNGSGKTQLLQAIARSYSGLIPYPGAGRFPGGVVAVSYSPFDNFRRPRPRAMQAAVLRGAYTYCGLRRQVPSVDGSKPAGSLDLEWSVDHAVRALAQVPTERRARWHKLVAAMVGTDLALAESDPWTHPEDFRKKLDQASAGHQLVALVLAHLVAELRPGTLIVFDEPETHLHPRLLSTLLRLLHELLEQPDVDSFALLATHSPIPVQEVPARMVRILSMHDRVPRVDPYPRESFGEELAELIVRAFQVDPGDRNFEHLLSTLSGSIGREAVEQLFPNGLPLGARAALRRVEEDVEH